VPTLNWLVDEPETMSQKDTQKERSSETVDTGDLDDISVGGSTGRDRMPVSNRSSWTGLAKRALNVTGGGGTTDLAGAATLGGAMLVGAIVTGLLPIPLLWIVGLGAGAAVAGRYESGSVGFATLFGGVAGLVGGLGFATALFGLGVFLTLLTTVLGAVAGAVGFLVGLVAAQ